MCRWPGGGGGLLQERKGGCQSHPPPPRVAGSLRGPGHSPILPFTSCVRSLLSDGRCGLCSLWCRFCVSGAQ